MKLRIFTVTCILPTSLPKTRRILLQKEIVNKLYLVASRINTLLRIHSLLEYVPAINIHFSLYDLWIPPFPSLEKQQHISVSNLPAQLLSSQLLKGHC